MSVRLSRPSLCGVPRHEENRKAYEAQIWQDGTHHTVTSEPILRSKDQTQRSRSPGWVMLTQLMSNIFRTGQRPIYTNFKLGTQTQHFGTRIAIGKSHLMSDKLPPKGAWSKSRGHFLILNPFRKSATGEARNIKCVSLLIDLGMSHISRMIKIMSPKWAWSGFRGHLFILNPLP